MQPNFELLPEAFVVEPEIIVNLHYEAEKRIVIPVPYAKLLGYARRRALTRGRNNPHRRFSIIKRKVMLRKLIFNVLRHLLCARVSRRN